LDSERCRKVQKERLYSATVDEKRLSKNTGTGQFDLSKRERKDEESAGKAVEDRGRNRGRGRSRSQKSS
jgi:hypothetical protein